jgi:hypothetical protein
MHTYKLYLPIQYKILIFGVLFILTLVGLGLLAANIHFGPKIQTLPVPFILIFFLVIGWNWHVVLTIPYEIRMDETSRIEFVSLARHIVVMSSAVQSIKPAGGNSLYVLKHDQGKIRLFIQFTGFYEFLTMLKTVNPAVEIIGI